MRFINGTSCSLDIMYVFNFFQFVLADSLPGFLIIFSSSSFPDQLFCEDVDGSTLFTDSFFQLLYYYFYFSFHRETSVTVSCSRRKHGSKSWTFPFCVRFWPLFYWSSINKSGFILREPVNFSTQIPIIKIWCNKINHK